MYLLLKDMVLKQTWKGNCVFYSKQLVAAWSGGLKEILVLRRNNHIDYNICHRLRIYIGYYIGILYRHSGFNAIYLPSIPYFLSQNIKNDFAVNKMKHNIEMTCYLKFPLPQVLCIFLTQESLIIKHQKGCPFRFVSKPSLLTTDTLNWTWF